MTTDSINAQSIGDASNTLDTQLVLPDGNNKITGSVGGTDSSDCYQFVAQSSGDVALALTGLNGDLDLYVTDSKGVPLFGSFHYGNADEHITYPVVAGQTYLIQVNPSYKASSNYNLDVILPRSTLAEIISKFDTLSVKKTGLENADGSGVYDKPIFDNSNSGGGFWKLFFALSAASYVHIPELGTYDGMEKNETTSIDKNFKNKFLKSLTECGLQPITKAELNTNGFVESQAAHFDTGFFVGNELTGSSVATAFRSKDEVFLTFRGTDVKTDMSDDALDMNGHYSRFSSFFDSLNQYIKANGISKVWVSGHSLGGEMAAMYMNNHPDKDGITYRAVTLEAANKDLPTSGDDRFINFEMNGDVVPDLGRGTHITLGDAIGNYGKTIFLNDDREGVDGLFSTHFMTKISPIFDDIAKNLPIDSSSINADKLIYIDGPNTDSVVNTDGITPLRDPDTIFSVAKATATLLSNIVSDNPIYSTSAAIIYASLGFPLATAAVVTGAVLGAALQVIAQEDNNELVKMGTNFQVIWPDSSKQGTLVIHPTDSETYTTPENAHLGAIVIANDNFSLSEDLDIDASKTTNDLLLGGNDGNNWLTGGSGNDLIVGAGNSPLGEDVLIGGAGNDLLFGGNYEDNPYKVNPLVNFGITQKGLDAIIKNYSDRGDTVDNNTYMSGGTGNDVMYGSGDNDYFFIDVNLSGGNPFSNKSNVDDIHSFYVSGPDILSEDYLCFKASQLGLTEAAMTKMGWNKETLTVLGQKLTAYAMDIELTKSETFFKVDGISEYKTEFIEDNLPAFILDTSNGDLYFDQDGDKIVGDQVLVAHLIGTKGDDLSNMHANQILVFPNL